LKEPIGKQDQFASAYGGFNAYYFHKDDSVTIEPVNIREEVLMELQSNMFLFYLNQKRSASNVLIEQDTKSKNKDKNVIDRLHKIKGIGIETLKIFEKGKIDEFGEILNEHWLTKKGLSKNISNSFIDEVYETARKNGALGGKIVGAGGGGFLLLYCSRDKTKLVEAMKKHKLYPTWFAFEPEGAKKVYYN
jgi:D-glycero-alpha-D-manno-heptose-7-phosphate kinase